MSKCVGIGQWGLIDSLFCLCPIITCDSAPSFESLDLKPVEQLRTSEQKQDSLASVLHRHEIFIKREMFRNQTEQKETITMNILAYNVGRTGYII